VKRNFSVKYIVIASGLFFSGVTATHAQYYPAETIKMRGNISTLHAGSNNQLFVVYNKVDCSASEKHCFSYSVISNNSLSNYSSWLPEYASFYGRAQRHVTSGPDGELYIATMKNIYKLPADTSKNISTVFTSPEQTANKQHPLWINNFVFNEDYSKLYIGIEFDELKNGVAAIDTQYSEPGHYLWFNEPEYHSIYGVSYNAPLKQLHYWGLANYADPSPSEHVLSAYDGKYIPASAPYFDGAAVIAGEKNTIYGANVSCTVSKVKLADSEEASASRLWHYQANDCAYGSVDDITVSRGTDKGDYIYAGYQNAIYVINHESGTGKTIINAPAGTVFKNEIAMNPKNGWGYRAFLNEKNGSGGVLAFSPDGQKSKVIIRQANIMHSPVILNGSLYLAANDTSLIRYDLNQPEKTEWESIKTINTDIIGNIPENKAIKIGWSVKRNGSEVESDAIMLNPRDETNGVISPYHWPFALATAINDRSMYVKAGEKHNAEIAPLYSLYRNHIYAPVGEDITIDFTVNTYAANSIVPRLKMNPAGSYLCSYGDIPAGTEIKVTYSSIEEPSFVPAVTRSYYAEEGKNGQYSWPKFLSDFINTSFANEKVYAGEKMDDSEPKVVTRYSYYRNRLWIVKNNRKLTIDLPAAIGEVAQQCR